MSANNQSPKSNFDIRQPERSEFSVKRLSGENVQGDLFFHSAKHRGTILSVERHGSEVFSIWLSVVLDTPCHHEMRIV